jgi:hypothetical protein
MSEKPVWQVGARELSSDLAKIEQQWNYVRDILESPDLYVLRNGEISGWSCGEHAGHVVLVTRWIASGIEQNLREPTRDADGAWAEPTESILVAGDFRRGAAESPPEVNTFGRDHEEFLPVLPAAEAAWREIASKSNELPRCEARFPHFALGYLNSTEWVRFCALHTAHHLAVVRDLRVGAA